MRGVKSKAGANLLDPLVVNRFAPAFFAFWIGHGVSDAENFSMVLWSQRRRKTNAGQFKVDRRRYGAQNPIIRQHIKAPVGPVFSLKNRYTQ